MVSGFFFCIYLLIVNTSQKVFRQDRSTRSPLETVSFSVQVPIKVCESNRLHISGRFRVESARWKAGKGQFLCEYGLYIATSNTLELFTKWVQVVSSVPAQIGHLRMEFMETVPFPC